MWATLTRVLVALNSGALNTLIDGIKQEYQGVQKRIQTSPGLPVGQPTLPYWTIPVAAISQHGKDDAVPKDTDIVIIGSGITGASVARNLLQSATGDKPRVVMLEARDACSGATARNGGHITPNLYNDYTDLKTAYGKDVAKQIINFRLGHLEEFLRVSAEENVLVDSQCRKVETFDLYLDGDEFKGGQVNLAAYLKDFPEQKPIWRVVDKVETLQVDPEVVVGAITTTAGAMHPYRFVTTVLSNLLSKYPQNFQLLTNTPSTKIESDNSQYIITTPRGKIRAKHVVHATNGWSSTLLPQMRGKVVPIRGHMTAHRPGQGLGAFPGSSGPQANNSWAGTRSFTISGVSTYNYLTQQPPTSTGGKFPSSNGELMFGGGLDLSSLATVFPEIGSADDHSPPDLSVGGYLSGALSAYFGKQWGAEGQPGNNEPAEVNPGRVLKVWTGILGISADLRPWVGRVPTKITGRGEPKKKGADKLAAPGEWIAAGYSGEGMVHAYLSGKAVANQILGSKANATVPAPFVISEARWKKANIEDLITG
ncbi:FAD-dependent protein [Mycena indigotica]|uniref:FAD-dependent protein n=1 Tax=Mycena indigotica TaxID=2126181 RepID=A0A8H6VT14_9AGAR|nr:FAD-dependent protein [Mycena indigotica]KAF7292844.1 FAD-dependent protein [Mycena indigotica]